MKVNGRPYPHGFMVMMNTPEFGEDAYDANPEDISKAVKPGVSAIMIAYDWRDLEPDRGRYNFEKVQNAHDYLKANHPGVGLVAMLRDRSFHNERRKDWPINPDWLMSDGLDLIFENGATGHMSKRWDPQVTHYRVSLHNALNNRFMSSEVFLGTATQETATGLSQAQRHDPLVGYSQDGYATSLISLAEQIALMAPEKRLFFYMNYLQADGDGWHAQDLLARVVKIISRHPYNVAIGGPDLLPYNKSLVNEVYPIYRQLPSTAYKFCSAQFDSMRHKRPSGEFVPPEEIIALGKLLGVQTVVVNRSLFTKPYTIDDFYPIMNRTKDQWDTLLKPHERCPCCERYSMPEPVLDYLVDSRANLAARKDEVVRELARVDDLLTLAG